MSVKYSNPNSEFYKTYLLYKEYIGYEHPYSYSQWVRLPEQFKAGALYCQYYDEITLAWYKVKTDWSIEEEGVETINQYLIKNVEKILNDEKRFNPRYLYKVAYNCLYCVCIDPSKNKTRYYSETAESFLADGDEVSWFDYFGVDDEYNDDSGLQELCETFESMKDVLQYYLEYLMDEITEFQLCRKLKKSGYTHGNIRNKEYRAELLSEFLDFANEAVKKEILDKCPTVSDSLDI